MRTEKARLEIEKYKILGQVLQDFLQSQTVSRFLDALVARMTSTERRNARTHLGIAHAQAKSAHSSTIFFLIALTLCLGFLSLVIWILKSDKELLLPVLSPIITLLAGTGGGYVFGRQSVTGKAG